MQGERYMVKKIRNKANKAICAIVAAAMLFSNSGIPSVTAADTAEQKTAPTSQT